MKVKLTRRQAINRLVKLETMCTKLARKWRRDILIYLDWRTGVIDYTPIGKKSAGLRVPVEEALEYCYWKGGYCETLGRYNVEDIIAIAQKYGVTEEI